MKNAQVLQRVVKFLTATGKVHGKTVHKPGKVEVALMANLSHYNSDVLFEDSEQTQMHVKLEFKQDKCLAFALQMPRLK
ncbi:hypothetical protein Tco_0602340 [Tanacetum coccineum]